MNTEYIGKRIKALRESNGMKQTDLAGVLDLKDRQSVSALENGIRRVSADELIKIVDYFKVSLQDISNPFLLYEREVFSWRQNQVASTDLDDFERRAGEWIGAFRTLSKKGSEPSLRKLLPNLELTHKSSFENAVSAGESVAAHLDLPEDSPALGLQEAIEEKFGILVLMVDAIPGISGAACHLPEINAILINRNEPPGRRHADMAHELFRILTWSAMKPERVESSQFSWENDTPSRKEARNGRIVQLADNFNSGLLIPNWSLDKLHEPREDAEWLDAAADRLGVTSLHLKWRLVTCGLAPGMAQVDKSELLKLARLKTEPSKPLLYSKRFMKIIGKAIDRGDLSARRAAKMLSPSMEDLAELFDSHDLSRPDVFNS